ncbi:J domain-containing protein [Lysobacter sp. LF1]|uniref:J domain-containing protein n=1 Tax=Lysobacter stagni TaxID=3045172 RepID=A0ABT6XBY9_9GAMM|nr:J domain-containing protein [Lysobacter sp. LF1]MDI9237658.1 J domain-containing protein [Lysobacter sp. LF1]
MNWNEWAVVIGGGALGYWLVSVMWPHLREKRVPATAPPPVPDARVPMWHEALGVPPNADRDTIEAAFRAKFAEYRPERIAHLPPDAQAYARARATELELAYDAARRDLEWLRPRRD